MSQPEFGTGLKPMNERGSQPRDTPEKLSDQELMSRYGGLALSLLLIVIGTTGLSICVGILFGLVWGLGLGFAIILILGVLVGFTA